MALRPALAAALACLLVCAACRRERQRPDRTEPWLASASVAPSASARALAPRARYTLARSNIEFELPARHGTPRGRLRVARGELDVDLDEPSRTTGKIELELDSIELFAEGGSGPEGAFTEQALAWLELGPGVPDERRSRGRIATFTLGALEGGASPPRRDDTAGRHRLRSGEWSAKGDLALHGVRVSAGTSVLLTVSSTPDGTEPPAELVIRSRRPLGVLLSTHDIRPRDARGVLLPRQASLLGDRVGREAKVSFELVFVARQ